MTCAPEQRPASLATSPTVTPTPVGAPHGSASPSSSRVHACGHEQRDLTDQDGEAPRRIDDPGLQRSRPMICCQFIFKPGTYDQDFHRLDAQIDQYARSLPGFQKVETWQSGDGAITNAIYYFADRDSLAQLTRLPEHREAKGQVQRWYDGYRIVVSEITATYGDGRLDQPD